MKEIITSEKIEFEDDTNMLKIRNRIITDACDYNSLSTESKSTRNDYLNSVVLSIEKSKVQYQLVNKMFTHRIPNILKSTSRKNRNVKKLSSEIVLTYIEESVQKAHNPIRGLNNLYSEKTCLINNNNTCRKSTRRRKQEHDFIDTIQKSSNICTFFDDKTDTKNCKKRKEIKRGRRKEKSKGKVSTFETEKQKENSSPLTSDDKSVEFVTHNNVTPYLNETEFMNLEGSIDFSSNEIFSNFNYELHYNSGSTIYNSEICERQYDMNSNEVGIDETQHSILSEHWNDDIPYYDKKSNCSSNLCCSYCNENNAAAIDEERNMMDEMPENAIINNSDNKFINEEYSQEYVLPISNIPEVCNFNENGSCLLSKGYNENSSSLINEGHNENSSNLLNEGYNESSSNLLTSNKLENFLLENMDSSSSKSTISCTKEDIEEEILREQTTKLGGQCNIFNDNHDEFFQSFDLSINSLEFEKVDTEVCAKENTNDDKFQCLLCSLTFSSARTMAIHRARAHGDTYIILCESCGRLFNQKYHFNRHFSHCGGLQEPYKCDKCLKIYKHRSSLVQHLKNVHEIQYTGHRAIVYMCSECNKQYSKLGAFKKHVERHNKTS